MLNYEIISVLSETAKSRVYLAAMPEHRGPVIIKELSLASLKVYEQLRDIQSPFFPRIYACEAGKDLCVVAEEYLDGVPLDTYAAEHAPSADEYLDLFLQLCEGVSILHSLTPPIIHRDLKPSNLLIGQNGQLHIIDFDASRNYAEDSPRDTRLLGTDSYAAPEQFGYAQTDIRSDIYAIGATMYELSFGKPFPKDPEKLADPSAVAAAPDPALARKLLPVITKCTRFDPNRRYPDLAHVTQALLRCRRSQFDKRRSWIAAAFLILAVAGFGTTIVLSISPLRADTDARSFDPWADTVDYRIYQQMTSAGTDTYDPDTESIVPLITTHIQDNMPLTPFYLHLVHENGSAPVELILYDPERELAARLPADSWEYNENHMLHLEDSLLRALEPGRDYTLSVVYHKLRHTILIHPMKELDYAQERFGPAVMPGESSFSLGEPQAPCFAACNTLCRKILSVSILDTEELLTDNECMLNEQRNMFTLSTEFLNRFSIDDEVFLYIDFEEDPASNYNRDSIIRIVITE